LALEVGERRKDSGAGQVQRQVGARPLSEDAACARTNAVTMASALTIWMSCSIDDLLVCGSVVFA
jgi:hypothetical protein